MRHHSGSSYPEKYHPHSEAEWIIWLADNISSGSDRREDAERGSLKPRPPFQLTHPLSNGSSALVSFDVAKLNEMSSAVIRGLKVASAGFDAKPEETYAKIYGFLEGSSLKRIPADTRSPFNDVSLWHHSKLTAAVAACITEHGYHGSEPSSYGFALLSGDADKVSSYIGESKRIPDLNARSERIRVATSSAGKAVADLAGPEAVIFAGGGSLLALLPEGVAESGLNESVKAFEEASEGSVTFTANLVSSSGDSLMRDFGLVWERAGVSLRLRKLNRQPVASTMPVSSERVCDVCGRRTATVLDEQRLLPIDAAPRYESLCDSCWKLRRSGVGVWVEDIESRSGYIAVLKADGDGVGDLLSGRRLKAFGKTVTPGRLATLSELLNGACEINLGSLIRNSGGHVIFAGGDDILALVPGGEALKLALEVSRQFERDMNNSATLSAGLALFPSREPIYLALEVVSRLLREAKSVAGKGAVSYEFLGSKGGVGHSTVTWSDFESLLGIVDLLVASRIPKSQLRRISAASIGEPYRAEAMIKYSVGRGVLPRDHGDKLMHALMVGRLAEAFMIHSLLEVK